MEVDKKFYLFGSFSRKRQEKRKSLQLQQSLSTGSSPLHRNSQPPCLIHIPPRTSAYEIDRGGWRCGLCGGKLTDPRLLGCLHSFCTGCLQGLHHGEWNDYDAGSFLEPGGSRSTSGAGSAGSGYESEIRENSGSEGSWGEGERPHKYGIFTRKVSGKSVQFLICPTCGHETQLPLGGISALPLNYVLMRKMAMEDRDDGILCDLCSTDNKAENRCNQCLVSVCGACSEAHGRHAATARHALTPLGPATPRCTQHPRSERSVYCATCQQVVCRDCCISSHSGHAMADAVRAASERARLLRDACERASEMPASLQRAMNDLSVQEAEVDVQAAQVEAEIAAWADQYKRAVDAHGRALRSAASKARARYRVKFAERARELRARVEQAREAVAFAEEVLSEAREDELLALSGPVLRRLSRVADAPNPPPRCELRFCPTAPAGADAPNGALVGRLLTSEPDWRTTVLNTEGLQDLRVGCRHEATLELRDSRRERVWSGGARVAGYFRRADSAAAPHLAQVTDRGDGTYTLAVCPPSPGAYYLAVTLDNKPIQGSPFPCAVRSPRAHSGRYHASAQGDGQHVYGETVQNGVTHPRHWSCCGAKERNSHCVKESPLYHFSL